MTRCKHLSNPTSEVVFRKEEKHICYNINTHTFSFSLSHSHTLILSFFFFLFLSLPHTNSFSLSYTLTHTLFLLLFLSLTYTNTHTLSLSLIQPHIISLSFPFLFFSFLFFSFLFFSFTQMHTHTLEKQDIRRLTTNSENDPAQRCNFCAKKDQLEDKFTLKWIFSLRDENVCFDKCLQSSLTNKQSYDYGW